MSKSIEDTPSSKQTGTIDLRIILLTLGMFALGTDAFVVAGVLPIIAHDIQVTEGLAGQLVTIFSLTYGLGAPVLAALTGRFSRNQVLMVALAAFALVNIGSALAPNFSLLLFTRLLAGCCAALYAPLAYTVGTSLAPAEKRGQALALVVLGLTVATVFGSPLGTWIGEHFNWRLSFALVAVLAGIAFIGLLLGRLPSAGAAPILSLKARLAPVAEPHLLLALAPALLWNLSIYVIYTYIAPILQQGLHITDVSGLLLVFGIGVVLGNIGGGFIADRFGAIRPIVASLIVLILVFVTLPFSTTTIPGTIAALFIWGIAGTLVFTPQQHRMLGLAPQHANVILALNNSTLYLGIAGGAAVGGFALQFTSVTHFGWIAAAFALLALLVLLLGVSLHAQRHTPSSVERGSSTELQGDHVTAEGM
jgi:predicted MFS family arabinose efflux permease